MPSVIKLICEWKKLKKIVWKDDYLKLKNLEAAVSRVLEVEGQSVTMFCKLSFGKRLLACDCDITAILNEQQGQDFITLQVVSFVPLRDEKLISKDYSFLCPEKKKSPIINEKPSKDEIAQNFIDFCDNNNTCDDLCVLQDML